MDLTPQDIASKEAAYWADLNEIELQSGIFSFKDHEYQWEPMSSLARRICYVKGRQGGFTEIEVLKSLHGMIYKKYPQGVLYTFPTSDVVNDFSKSRFNPLILANRQAIGHFVRKTDTASLKKIHKAFLYLRGARLSQKIGSQSEQSESAQMRGIPTDRVVFDEVDLMDDEVIAKACGTMGHSRVKEEVYISNPTLPDFGIDKIFHTSDQRHWFRKCSHCGERTCAELSFPDCVKIRKDGTGYIGCNKCGKELLIDWKDDKGVFTSEWVASVPSNSDVMHGYRWSQLTSVFNDPAEILSDFINPPQGNLGDVYRLKLGLPYVAAEDRLNESEVFSCCGSDISPHSHEGPCAMGVDVGKIKHVVIGTRLGKKRFRIVRAIQLSDWNDIHDIARRYNVKSAVIDIRPYEDSARQFQKSEPYRVFLCEYSESMPTGPNYNNKTGIVKINRTEIFDSTHRLISDGRLTIPRRCPEVEEFAKQVCATAKVLETNKRSGTSIYRYIKLGQEHFRNALNYFYMAASKSGIAYAKSHKNEQVDVISDYVRI